MKQKLLLLTVALLAVLLMGCTEEEQRPVWGKGDLPAVWQGNFGNDNGSRLDFVQSRVIDEIAKRLITLEANQYMPNYQRIDRVERWLTKHTAYDPNEGEGL